MKVSNFKVLLYLKKSKSESSLLAAYGTEMAVSGTRSLLSDGIISPTFAAEYAPVNDWWADLRSRSAYPYLP